MTVEHLTGNNSPSEWTTEEKIEADEMNGTLVSNDAVAVVDSGGGGGGNGGGGDGDSDSDDEDLRCGLGVCSPKWMQVFASKQAFLVTFCITWVLQGMYYTYFVSVITTIEKLFQIQSKTTGIIMSATEIGQIGSSLLLTYFGGQGHRPKWIAWGMVLFAVSSFSCTIPHFIFGDQLIHANEVLYSGLSADTSQPNLCRAEQNIEMPAPSSRHILEDSPTMEIRNAYFMLQATGQLPSQSTNETLLTGGCKEELLQEQRAQTKITKVVLATLFISLLGVGMGQTAVYTLGIPYIDDNVANRESALYFAITIGVRILGPAMGFMLGSLCTRLYADLSASPQFTPTDPRWVGAWWLGLVIVSSLLMLSSFAMFSFPKRLKSYHGRPVKRRYVSHSKNPSLKDFPAAVKRLLKNDILMFRTASSVLHILPVAGLYTFLPKYLESQFRLPAHSANMISGIGGILVMGLGIIISGVFILRVKPNARFVAAWIAFTAIVYAIGMCVLMVIGCPMNNLAGLEERQQGFEYHPQCNSQCACVSERFSPVCGSDGVTYFSACHAGCRNVTIKDGFIEEFTDCLCVDQSNTTNVERELKPPSSYLSSMTTAYIGYCDLNCSNFVPYILLFSLFVFIHSTSEVGSMLLILRCVHPRDKAMALGLIQFAIGLFGNVPCPIVYGAVVDYACLIWDKACGKQGACWLYDSNLFRTFFHGTTGAILLCAFLVDIVVWYKAGSINFVEEPTEQPTDELSPIKSRSETSV